jgi:hypothetical protein
MSRAAIDALMAQSADGVEDDADDQLDAIASDAELDALAAGEDLPSASAEAPPAPEAHAPESPAAEAPAAEAPAPEAPAAEAPESVTDDVDPLEGGLSEAEIALGRAVANDDSPPEPNDAKNVAAPAEATDGADPVKMRRWSAASTSDNDQLRERVQDLEDKIGVLEATTVASTPSVGDGVDPQEVADLKQNIEQLTATGQSVSAALQQLTEHSQCSLGFAAKQTFDCPECQRHGTISVPISCTFCGYESEWGFYPEQ